jgi:hypothetical protein
MPKMTLEQEFERELRFSRMTYYLRAMEYVGIAIRSQTVEQAEWINESLYPFLFDEMDKAIKDYDDFMERI